MGNPDAKAAAKRRKEERRQGKFRLGGRVSTKRAGTRRKHIQGNDSSNDRTKDPRVK